MQILPNMPFKGNLKAYYKVRLLALTQCYSLTYYKVRQVLLHSVTGIAKPDDYYKVRQNKVSARAENPSPVSKTGLGFSARAKGLKTSLKISVFVLAITAGMLERKKTISTRLRGIVRYCEAVWPSG